MNEAMNLSYGDLIIIEIALVTYMKDLDLSMQSGQYISELLGKLEYQLAQIKAGVAAVKPMPVQAAPGGPPAPGQT